MTPGLHAAAIVAEHGRVLAGDAELGAAAEEQAGVEVVRGAALTLVARVGGGALRGLLEADMATALAVAERGRAA